MWREWKRELPLVGANMSSVWKGIHPEMVYHVFRVLKWQTLDETITPEEIGPNPIAYTNYFLLSTSKSYSELRIRNEADYRFFMELKRRAKTQIVDGDDSDSDDSVAFIAGDSKVLQKDGMFYVYKDGRRIGEQTVEEFKRRPNATFRVLRKYMKKMEGEGE